MENPTFTRVSLSDVRVIMVIMRILVEELLYQAVMRRIPVLECLLSGSHRCLWLRPILPSIKWHRYPRNLALWPLAWYLGHLRAWLPGSQTHAVLGRKDEVVWADRW
jgi:DMSO/TMAO reductase YedYZ heme-binding membrane subunit